MKKTIMIVDDEPDTLELTKTVLAMSGFEVKTFDNAKRALDSLKKSIPDLVLLDMRMPEISGPDFCIKIANDPKLKCLKIVFFTASSEMCKEVGVKNNVKGYIFKPFDNDALVDQVKKYLAM